MTKLEFDRRVELINIRPRPDACSVECPLHPASPSHNPQLSGGFVPPLILPKTDLLVVGIVPAEEEELGGEPLIGPSGRYADHTLRWAAGQTRPFSYSKANLVNCRTVKVGKRGLFVNRTPPTALEMRTCFHAHLRRHLQRKWRLVLLFGGETYKWLVPTEHLPDKRTRPMFDQFSKAMGHRLVFDIEHHVGPRGTIEAADRPADRRTK